ncbi:hypothetical protein [Vallitalea guaymasensis]|uniref:Uncharacterized protein n=1 Tax=Vallitalea guaymasensis TaxID=1185412 RepID=A0A8J8MDW6_9FIRM|nr:hypothetical protein [Vallitalea guaymasensis]QUH31156.1 hypothetical protein HYG85_20415 [Vallitalea guaymasensis]
MIELDEESMRIYNESQYTHNSTDNNRMYNKHYYGVNCNKQNVSTQIGIRYTVTDANVILLASGGVSGLHDTCYIVDQGTLLICVGDCIFSINIMDLSLNWVIQGDDITCFQMFKANDMYVIHGELGISAVTSDGEIRWCFRGRNIFVTPDGKDDFRIIDDKIHLTDWEGNKYILDLEGNLL